MYFYFSSSFPAGIKFNGIYYGIINDTVKCCNFDYCFCPFVEICPLDNNGNQLNFLIDDNFLKNPPDKVVVTDMKGGYLIKFEHHRVCPDFKVIAQNKFNNALVTVFNENGLKLSIETRMDFYAETLPTFTNSAQISEFTLNGNNFICVFFPDEKTLIIYLINEKIDKVFLRQVSEYDLKNRFTTKENYTDMAKHVVVTEWKFENNVFLPLSKSVTCTNGFNFDKLNDKLKPFAFLEEVLVGGDYSSFLADKIKENADKLPSYLGEFIGIMPPPMFRNIDEIGLIYPNGKNIYRVDYCSFELENGKICNVKKLDK